MPGSNPLLLPPPLRRRPVCVAFYWLTNTLVWKQQICHHLQEHTNNNGSQLQGQKYQGNMVLGPA